MQTLYPTASDTPGSRVLFKIDGGPGRLDIKSLAQLRAKGCYLFPGVQNTTHVTQETDRNYGQFKSLLRKHLQQLMNDLHAKYRREQQVREQQGNQENLPPLELPKLSQKIYGAILGGMEADEENGIRAIPNIFAASFNKDANLRSWRLCGAVPLTRSALQHRSVRQEIATEENTSEDDNGHVVVFEEYCAFDWANFTLDEMESLNKAACARLSESGYNGSELLAKVNRRPKSLASRLPRNAPLEERVKEIVRGGISLSSLFYTVGPQCLSSDEIFLAFEYRERLKLYEKEKKTRSELDKKKALQDKAKALLDLQKENYLKPELQSLLQWKLGPARYAEHSKKNIRELEEIWRLCSNEPNPPDVIVPPPLEEPAVPMMDETELGRAKQHQFEIALRTATSFNSEQLEELARVITGLRQERSVPAAEV
jgi:hypothetical protein